MKPTEYVNTLFCELSSDWINVKMSRQTPLCGVQIATPHFTTATWAGASGRRLTDTHGFTPYETLPLYLAVLEFLRPWLRSTAAHMGLTEAITNVPLFDKLLFWSTGARARATRTAIPSSARRCFYLVGVAGCGCLSGLPWSSLLYTWPFDLALISAETNFPMSGFQKNGTKSERWFGGVL